MPVKVTTSDTGCPASKFPRMNATASHWQVIKERVVADEGLLKAWCKMSRILRRSPVNDRLERSCALCAPIMYGSGCNSAAFAGEISVEFSFSPVLARSVPSGGGFGLDLSYATPTAVPVALEPFLVCGVVQSSGY